MIDMTYATRRQLYNELAACAFLMMEKQGQPNVITIFNGWRLTLDFHSRLSSGAAGRSLIHVVRSGLHGVLPLTTTFDSDQMLMAAIGDSGAGEHIITVAGREGDSDKMLMLFRYNDDRTMTPLTTRPYRANQTHNPTAKL